MVAAESGLGGMELRAAAATDVPALRDLISRSVRGLSAGLYSSEQVELALVHVFGVDTQLLVDGTYYVAADGEQIAAAGGWSARETLFGGDQAKHALDPPVDPATTPARIRAFFVDPRWTRRGLARRLFEKCEAAARDRGFRRFELVATLPGIPLYRSLGFAPHEDVLVPLPGGLVLPCVRMERAISLTFGEART